MTPNELKAWRLSLRLTQQGAAEVLGMTRQGYQLMEYGRYDIDRRTELACAAIQHGLGTLHARRNAQEIE